ncbi:MAG TPA: class II fructose-bisphosphate aldolase [Anaerolineales bacterium]|nr:class II fructose-bisphosphate aldolase [Anaerolineales bacterium]
MPIVNAKDMLVEAAKGGYAIGAFNITNLIQMEGVVDAAVDKRSPAILQTSVITSKFLGADVLTAIFRTIAAAAPVPICLHLNHGTEVEYCKRCADAGYTNIMIDASLEPLDENIRQTCEVVQYCHAGRNASVEGGLGHVGETDQPGGSEPQLANPRQAAEYVQATGVDLFAPAIGTAHGIYKSRNPQVDVERLAQIHHMLNGNGVKTPLVVHGGTGLPEDTIKRLIEAGGTKFNVSTEFKRTLIDAQFEYMSAHREEYEPGRIDVVARDAIRKAVGRWIQMLGSAGKA